MQNLARCVENNVLSAFGGWREGFALQSKVCRMVKNRFSFSASDLLLIYLPDHLSRVQARFAAFLGIWSRMMLET